MYVWRNERSTSLGDDDCFTERLLQPTTSKRMMGREERTSATATTTCERILKLKDIRWRLSVPDAERRWKQRKKVLPQKSMAVTSLVSHAVPIPDILIPSLSSPSSYRFFPLLFDSLLVAATQFLAFSFSLAAVGYDALVCGRWPRGVVS